MSSPASTPSRRGGSKRGRSSNPPTRSPLTYGTPSSRVEGTPRSGVRGTPVRQKPDLGYARKARQVDLHSVEPAKDALASEQSLGQKLVIWGTDTIVASCKVKFRAVTKGMFEEALHALADDDFLTVTGKTVRLL
ncbi:hypothetical protein KIL84_011985 [Mauremys mutica]|uniref:Uncharacterized protein n=1 Tax=Mauremys mutica TaxID=74926 RepID=A0A9D3XF91_9SAUR|nr:hypothetical protein KIL84_011985 [Mauremys mutica]